VFHLLKDKPLGIRPLFVRRDDQVQGLTHLVTLALRVLTLFEVLVRRGQEQGGEDLKGRLSSLCCFSVLEFMPESVPSRRVFQVGMQ
jgi:transposase